MPTVATVIKERVVKPRQPIFAPNWELEDTKCSPLLIWYVLQLEILFLEEWMPPLVRNAARMQWLFDSSKMHDLIMCELKVQVFVSLGS